MAGSPFTTAVEALIEEYADRFATGDLELWQLPYPLSDLAWHVFWTGVEERDRLHLEREQAEADAERYYRAMCARPAPSTRALERRIEQNEYRRRRQAAGHGDVTAA